MRMIILAGGLGLRLRSVISDVPKPLAPVFGRPFLFYQLVCWRAQGINSFTFLLHYKAQTIIEFLDGELKSGCLVGCEVNYLIETCLLGTGGAIANAVSVLNLQKDFLVTNADTWLSAGISDMLDATTPSIGVINHGAASRFGHVQFNSDFIVTSFREKQTICESGWINSGLYRLNADLFNSWNGVPFSLEEGLFPNLIKSLNVHAVLLEGDFYDIGIPDDYIYYMNYMRGNGGSIL